MNTRKLHFICSLVFTIIRASQIQYQIYPGLKIKEIANTSSTLNKFSYIAIEFQCLNLCKEEMCKAVAFHKLNKLCVIGKYGRIILIPDPESFTWIKSMRNNEINKFLIF